MKHIGLDVHSTTTNIVVLNDAGRRLLSRKVATAAKGLKEVIFSIPGDKRLAAEERQMIDWVVRELAPLVKEIIRCQAQYNRLISRSEPCLDGCPQKRSLRRRTGGHSWATTPGDSCRWTSSRCRRPVFAFCPF